MTRLPDAHRRGRRPVYTLHLRRTESYLLGKRERDMLEEAGLIERCDICSNYLTQRIVYHATGVRMGKGDYAQCLEPLIRHILDSMGPRWMWRATDGWHSVNTA